VPRARFRVLGPFEVGVEREQLDIGALQLRRMLCILVVAAGRPVPTDSLIEWLWPGDSEEGRPKDPAATVRIYASRLRRLVPDQIGRSDEGLGYRLDVRPADVDAVVFENFLKQAPADGAPHPGPLAAALTEALALWHGPALVEFRDESWAVGTAVRLEELRLVALERLVDARLALGEEGPLCGELERLVELHPLRERFWSQLMLALYRSGRQAEALRAYQRLRHHLGEELGIPPSPELVEREAAVLRQDASLDRPDAAGPAALVAPGLVTAPLEVVPPTLTRSVPQSSAVDLGQTSPVQHGLPAQMTRFVGRERETAEVRALIAGFRLVTLTGPGGVGKTRLAVETAAGMGEHFPGGVVFVDLAPRPDAAELETAVAEAVGIKPRPGMRVADALAGALRGFELLLLLDNCEHMVTACAELCGVLLASCPGLRVLATSREPLDVYGEVVYRVLPLGLPPAGQDDPAQVAAQEAVELFVDRVRLQRASFALDDSNAVAVAALCRQLDGIPLALELAAARLRVLSVRDVLERVEDRFALLVGGRDRMPRQQTLGALIDWSFELLDSRQQSVLLRLGVFAGGFDLPAAESLLARTRRGTGTGTRPGPGSTLDDLVSLADKSLVLAETEGRFRMLETIKQYSLAKLAEQDGAEAVEDLRAAHAGVYLDLAERAAGKLASADQFEWFARLDDDMDNLRAALGYLVGHHGSEHKALRMLLALGRYFDWRGQESEVAAATDTLAARGSLADLTDPLVLSVILTQAKLLGRFDPERAIGVLEQALSAAEALGDQGQVSEMLNRLAWLHWSAGRWEHSRELHAAAVAAARASGHYLPLVLALNGGGAGREERLEALELARREGDGLGAYMALCNLGAIALDEGEAASARARFEEALPIMERVSAVDTDAALLVNLGTALVADGDAAGARPYYERGLRVARRHIDGRQTGYCLLGLAVCATDAGDPRRAAVLHGAAESQFRREGFALEEAERRMADEDRERLRRELSEVRFEKALEEGRLMGKDQVVELALAHEA
jgi:predicted ATPase/DNA-binding SARP family transcriptional activator